MSQCNLVIDETEEEKLFVTENEVGNVSWQCSETWSLLRFSLREQLVLLQRWHQQISKPESLATITNGFYTLILKNGRLMERVILNSISKMFVKEKLHTRNLSPENKNTLQQVFCWKTLPKNFTKHCYCALSIIKKVCILLKRAITGAFI